MDETQNRLRPSEWQPDGTRTKSQNFDGAFTGSADFDRTFTKSQNLDGAFTGSANVDPTLTKSQNFDAPFTGSANFDPIFTKPKKRFLPSALHRRPDADRIDFLHKFGFRQTRVRRKVTPVESQRVFGPATRTGPGQNQEFWGTQPNTTR